MELEPIDICRAASAGSFVLEAALQLAKHAHRFAKMQICMQQVSLQEVPVLVGSRGIPAIVLVVLESLARFPAKREKPVPGLIERYEFDRIPEVRSIGRIPQVREIIVVAELLEFRPSSQVFRRRWSRLPCDGVPLIPRQSGGNGRCKYGSRCLGLSHGVRQRGCEGE